MRQLLVVAVALVAVQAATAAPRTGFEFGRLGGSIQPFSVTIATTGSVKSTGSVVVRHPRLTKAQLANLNRIAFVVDFATLPAVTACPSTLPDIAAQFIRVGGRTVRVHGTCVKGFDRLWTALTKATGTT